MAKTTKRSTTDRLAVGRAALVEARWADARAIFEEALAAQETPEAFEGLSWPALAARLTPENLEAGHREARAPRRGGARCADREGRSG